jgi:uncharacterized iron-regulated membrane protein
MGSRQAWRKAWWQIHKWIGLLLMVLLIPLGLSGAVITWSDAIDHMLNPQRYAVHGAATLAPSAYAAAAQASLGPGERLSLIRLPRGEGPVVAWAVKLAPKPAGDHRHGGRGGPPQRLRLWLDPANARVLDVQRGDVGLVRTAHSFHSALFVPGPLGRALVGLLGVALFLMAVGGLWLWWPPIGQWVKGLRWQRGDRKLDTNLHHRIGFWIALPLAAQAFTGVWIAWPQMAATIGLAPARGGGAERGGGAPAETTRLTVDQALAAAEHAASGNPTQIVWPVGGGGPWHVTLKAKEQSGSEILVDDASGQAIAAPARTADSLAAAMRHYHDGTTLGTPWRVVMVLFGLSPTVLGITGFTMWWRGRRWRRHAAARKGRVREPVAAG